MGDKLKENKQVRCVDCKTFGKCFSDEFISKEAATRLFEKKLCRNYESIFNIPKHETVEQRENRTGKSYPDDAPVYVWTVNNPTCRKRWRLMEYNYSKSYIDVCEIIVANHHGKPEDNNG